MAVLRTRDGQKATDYCKEHNLCYGTFIYFLNRVGDVDEALELTSGPRKDRGQNATKFKYKGVPLKKMCDMYDDRLYMRLMNRCHNKKMSIEDAIEFENKKRKNIIEICYSNYIERSQNG